MGRARKFPRSSPRLEHTAPAWVLLCFPLAHALVMILQRRLYPPVQIVVCRIFLSTNFKNVPFDLLTAVDSKLAVAHNSKKKKRGMDFVSASNTLLFWLRSSSALCKCAAKELLDFSKKF